MRLVYLTFTTVACSLSLAAQPLAASIPSAAVNSISIPTYQIAQTNTWQQAQLLHSLNLYSLHPDAQGCVVDVPAQAISPNGQMLAISSYNAERACGNNTSALTLWNLQTGEKSATLIQGKAFEAFWLDGTPQAQEPPEGNTSKAGDVAHAVAFTPDGEQVIAGLSDSTVKIWDVLTGRDVRTLKGHRYAVHAIAISPDGQILASGSSDQTVKLWNLRTGQLKSTLSLKPSNSIIRQLTISPDGQTLVSAIQTNRIQLWDVKTGQLIRTVFEGNQSPDSFIPVAFSPDGQILATGERDNSIQLWNARTGTQMLTLKGHTKGVRSLAFSPNGQTLASSSDDNTVRFWNLKTHQNEGTLTDVGFISTLAYNPSPVNRLAFSPDGQTLAFEALFAPTNPNSFPNYGIKLWDVQRGQNVLEIPNAFSLAGFSFSPNGQILVATGPKTQVWRK
jgi:WD40 repeat protein